MNSAVNNILSTLEFKKQQECQNMKIFPILSPIKEGIHYITLKNALDMGFIMVTEIDDSGSVPELKVANISDIPLSMTTSQGLMSFPGDPRMKSSIRRS
jgi:hypothetical protein